VCRVDRHTGSSEWPKAADEFYDFKNRQSYKGRTMDALVLTGDEGRDKLRKATESGKYALTCGSPNGVTLGLSPNTGRKAGVQYPVK
jgi:hypothetical protein